MIDNKASQKLNNYLNVAIEKKKKIITDEY